MKRDKKGIAIAALGALCLLSSCNLDKYNRGPEIYWTGEYPVEMLDNTGGAWSGHTATISVWFRCSNTIGVVETAIVGQFAGNRRTFEAKWDGDSAFGLYLNDCKDQPQLIFSGELDGDKLALTRTGEEGSDQTYILTKKNN